MKTAVVILNWNGVELLKKYLESVCSNAGNEYEVWVVDNGSTDSSVGWLEEHHPEVRLVQNKKNYGFSEGYNRGLEQIDAEYYVLLNSDIEVTAGWTSPVISYMNDNPDVAACQPKILSLGERSKFEYAGASGGFIDRFGYPFCRGRIFDKVEEDLGQYDEPVDIFWASGAALFIRSAVWRELGGFDPDFFAHMEEIDLAWRIHAAGYRVAVVPQSVVYHLGGGTLTYSSSKKLFLNFRNNLYMLHKNLPERGMKRLIFIRMSLDGIAGLRFLLLLRPGAFFEIIRSHLAYYREKEKLYLKRRGAGGYRPNPGLMLNKSIVFLFYIKGKKRFSDLTGLFGK